MLFFSVYYIYLCILNILFFKIFLRYSLFLKFLDFPSFYLINEGRRRIGARNVCYDECTAKDLDLY